jgi:hypothetical protein
MFHIKHILFLNIFITTKKYNITFIQCLLTRYIFERWGNTHTHTHTHTHTYTKKTMLILNIFIYKSFYEKKEKKIFKISLLFKCMK